MRARISAKLMPAARTRIRISPSRGAGSGPSRISRTSAPPCRGITTWRIRPERTLSREQREQRFLGVQPVLGLIEHHRAGRVYPLVGDFLPAVRRQAVHEECILGRTV